MLAGVGVISSRCDGGGEGGDSRGGGGRCCCDDEDRGCGIGDGKDDGGGVDGSGV